jgi:hypothetical protein
MNKQQWLTTGQGEYDAANKHILNGHSPELVKNMTNKTIKLNTYIAALHCQSKNVHTAVEVALQDPTCTPKDGQLGLNL